VKGTTSGPIYYDGEPVQPEHGRTPEYIPADVLKQLQNLETGLISKDHSSSSVMPQDEWNELVGNWNESWTQ